MPFSSGAGSTRGIIPVAALLIACVCTSAALAQAPPSITQSEAANPSGRKYPARVYNTVRVEGSRPVIDGGA